LPDSSDPGQQQSFRFRTAAFPPIFSAGSQKGWWFLFKNGAFQVRGFNHDPNPLQDNVRELGKRQQVPQMIASPAL
jgi:hypothetical protein